jgi:hypothetical protein
MAGTSKRRSRPSTDKPREKPVDNEWEKEDEELDLEAQLFGRSKKRAKAGPSKSSKAKAEEADDEDMDDVRLFSISDNAGDTGIREADVLVVHGRRSFS